MASPSTESSANSDLAAPTPTAAPTAVPTPTPEQVTQQLCSEASCAKTPMGRSSVRASDSNVNVEGSSFDAIKALDPGTIETTKGTEEAKVVPPYRFVLVNNRYVGCYEDTVVSTSSGQRAPIPGMLTCKEILVNAEVADVFKDSVKSPKSVEELRRNIEARRKTNPKGIRDVPGVVTKREFGLNFVDGCGDKPDEQDKLACPNEHKFNECLAAERYGDLLASLGGWGMEFWQAWGEIMTVMGSAGKSHSVNQCSALQWTDWGRDNPRGRVLGFLAALTGISCEDLILEETDGKLTQGEQPPEVCGPFEDGDIGDKTLKAIINAFEDIGKAASQGMPMFP